MLVCLLLGVVYAFVLYRKDRLLEEVNPWLQRIMAVFRAMTVAFLAFLLLGPLLKTITEETEKPLVIIAQDNSESLLIGKDSTYYKGEYKTQLEALQATLGANYEVQTYSFGDQVRNGLDWTYADKQTNISELFDEVHTRYSNRNLGAIVVASDGIFNTGVDPVYFSKKLEGIPVYAVALGDTSVKKDLVVANVAHNRLAYLGNDFLVEVLVEAHQLMGKTTQLKISGKEGVVHTENIEITSNSFSKVFPVKIEAKKTGLQRYRIEVQSVEGEITDVNNSEDIFIDVLDSRQKILLLANSPHPDIKALSYAIESNENYEVKVALAKDFKGKFDPYSLVILHQLPARNNLATETLKSLLEGEVPTLFIWGSQSNFNSINQLQLGVTVTNYRGRLNEVNATYNKNFVLFGVSEETARMIERYPPLHVPFGTYNLGNSITPLFQQKIGVVKTQDPLFVFGEYNGTKIGIITGEGIWRWRLFDFAENSSHGLFNELITKTVQYLATKEDKSLFRVFTKHHFLENEPIVFEAEVYNESYELITEPEVSMVITDADGVDYPASFSATTNAYRLDAGMRPVGEYTYTAKVTYNGNTYTETGEFSVSPVQVELANTVANHQLLYNLASKSNGELLYPSEMDQLAAMIGGREEVKPKFFRKEEASYMLNLWWVLPLLLGLLSAEWFMRKRNGAY